MAWGSRLVHVGMALTVLGLVAGFVSMRSVSLVRWSTTPAREQAAAGTGQIGTEAPFTVLDADAQERWVALCQAREDTDKNGKLEIYREQQHGYTLGDQEDIYLVTGQGPGEKVGTFLRADASGRHIAFVRGHDWTVRDVITRREFSLRRDYMESPYKPYAPLLLSFGGNVVLASTLNSSWAYATLVELRWGISSQVDFGPGVIWSLAVDSTGRWARAEVSPDRSHLTEEAWLDLLMTGPVCVRTPDHAEKFPAKGFTLEERWADLWTGRLVPGPPAAITWPERERRLDLDQQPVSQSHHVLRPVRSPAHVHRVFARASMAPSHDRYLPDGPLRWQEPPREQPTRRDQRRMARTTVRQGDCAVYAPLAVTGDGPPRTTSDEENREGLVVHLAESFLEDGLILAHRQIGDHYRGFWSDLYATTMFGRSWSSRTGLLQQATPQEPGKLTADRGGRHYETTMEQLADEFVREAGDEPLDGNWPLYRGWTGFLNSIARHEGLPMRFVLSQPMTGSGMLVSGVRSSDVCKQVALDP